MQPRVVKSFRVLVGMEIHIQLDTQSKMFTGAANGFGGQPNSQVDEQVLGLPGVLPVMNRKAVEYAIKAGLALGCKIAQQTKWDRKSYYYPDLPKNYQISQYDLPLCYEGSFPLILEDGSIKTVRIRRAHLEEDAGKLLHDAPGGYRIDYSIVDLNRAGTPLLEIVTEPDLSSGQEVAAFGQELQKIVQFLGVSRGQMQMGQMRFEPNINVHITDEQGQIFKTAITEIKNLNSFSVLERATESEVRRQIRVWEETGSLGRKSTYGWDEATESTVHQRDKEDANDYRYFPDPDLPPVEVDDAWLAELTAQIGESPSARRQRYVDALGLAPADAGILAAERALGDFFDESVRLGAAPRRAANLLINVVAQLANRRQVQIPALGIAPKTVSRIAKMIDENQLAPSSALPLLEAVDAQSNDVQEVASRLGLLQVSDTSAIDAAIDAVIAQNPKALQDYRAGRQSALGAVVGMVMKQAKGLNPKMVQEQIRRKLTRAS
jgi:aspartyl-tRNA(Asn)/glutamyl-tRNA(Gln) amidotransferase subunit B